MVIYKGDEQHVGKGKEHRCEHIAVYSLQLHHLSEDSSEEEGGVGGENVIITATMIVAQLREVSSISQPFSSEKG